jgi:hypothetical protein
LAPTISGNPHFAKPPAETILQQPELVLAAQDQETKCYQISAGVALKNMLGGEQEQRTKLSSEASVMSNRV